MSFLRYTFLFILLAATNMVAKAQVSYFKQVKAYTTTSATATQLIYKLDSLKQTRRPNDSGIKTLYARDVDFGFKHQKISVELNSDRYTVDLLTLNDTLVISIIQYNSYIFNDIELEKFNKKNRFFKADTGRTLKYLALRNKFYKSDKTINNLKDEICSNTIYAHNCGEGFQKTTEFINVEKLVKHKDLKGLIRMLNSISCEEQAFGADGIRLLEKSGYKVPDKVKAITKYINQRNSDLTVCQGCLVGIIAKANK